MTAKNFLFRQPNIFSLVEFPWYKPLRDCYPDYFESRIPLKPALGGVCSFANYSVAYEETRSNRVSDFRDCVCSLFPKAILVLLLFYSTVAGVVPCGWP